MACFLMYFICRVSEFKIIKLADFGMSKDLYSSSYYVESNKEKPKPIRWMAPECLKRNIYNAQSEVVSWKYFLPTM